MRVVGYTNPLSVEAGGTVSLHASCEDTEFSVDIVRLRHGDLDPRGPGFRVETVSSDVEGMYPGIHHPVRSGSWAASESISLVSHELSLATWVWATTPKLKRTQYLAGIWRDGGAGVGLVIDANGHPAILAVDANGQCESVVRAPAVIPEREWHLVVGTVDSEGSMRLAVVRRGSVAGRLSGLSRGPARSVGIKGAVRLVVGARPIAPNGAVDYFNGKIGRPRLFESVVADTDVRLMLEDSRPTTPPVVDWDLSCDLDSDIARDVSGANHDGRLFNMPERGVTGWNWTAQRIDPALASQEYGAVWFHDDDLEDAHWPPSLTFRVPETWRSGIYAFRLVPGGDDSLVDHVPFIVRPQTASPRSQTMFLAPTFSWLAYAQDHAHIRADRLADMGVTIDELVGHGTDYERQAFQYILDNALCGLYDEHSDGSGVHYSSRLRPIPNMRPGFNKASSLFRLPHQLNGDLYLIDWLDEFGFSYDVASDEDLHSQGMSLLNNYRTLITGTHPEYWTQQMLDALEAWMDGGGRLMYLGGNGFYWVTSVDPKRPHVIEVRRRDFFGATAAPNPGEGIHSSTGEPGGTWAQRGRPSHQIVGVGTSAIGLDAAAPYKRTPDSHNSRVRFAFDGVTESVLGEHGLHLGSAAGWEVDCADLRLGTPEHALVIASANLSTHDYKGIIDRATTSVLEPANPNSLRADMVFFETQGGGAVFSVGSISFAASLSYDNYGSSLSRLTRNVLRRFEDPEPFGMPGGNRVGVNDEEVY